MTEYDQAGREIYSPIVILAVLFVLRHHKKVGAFEHFDQLIFNKYLRIELILIDDNKGNSFET